MIVAAGDNTRASTTIAALNLNREELLERREEKLRMLRDLATSAEYLQAQYSDREKSQEVLSFISHINQVITDAKSDAGEYSAMCKRLL